MAQYIDKAALVAEIEKRIKKYILLQQKPEMSDLQEELQNKIDCLNSIKGYIINTLEVKEVDLNDEKCEYLNNDGICIYALNKTGKVMSCQYINCYQKIKAQKGE